MAAADDRWVQAAMAEDALVADLLLRMYHSSTTLSSPPLMWRVRQRRSKSFALHEKRKRVSLLGSPSNPLSWSGATSVSGGSVGAAGSEESSRSAARDLFVATRSKISTDSERINSKRPKKKKTLAELKDEESTLLKERRALETEMAAMRLNLERQRAENDNIKRVKIELLPCLNRMSRSTLTEGHTILQSQPPGCGKEDTRNAPKFVLPDLNVPFDEHTLDVVCGVS